MLRRLHQGLERVADDDLDAGSQVVDTRYLDGQAPKRVARLCGLEVEVQGR
jgi:hypothetical protein